ncbi:hypothetical protein SAMN05421681_101108 [Lysobacter enzymogenes]|nr:hypothetical protein SAMN05421681_101108 [Lysobacter enzymogenes]
MYASQTPPQNSPTSPPPPPGASPPASATTGAAEPASAPAPEQSLPATVATAPVPEQSPPAPAAATPAPEQSQPPAAAAPPAEQSSPSPAPAPAPAPDPAPASALSELDEAVRSFARTQLGRALQAEEQQVLSAYVAMVGAQSQPPAPASPSPSPPPGGAAGVLENGRQQIEAVIRQSLNRAQAAVDGNAKAERAAETAVLGAVERAQSLQDLMPAKPAPGAAAIPPTPMEQIAARLADLVRHEVDACFQRQIGPLARQLQDVIGAAQSNGLLPPQTTGSAHPDESRATGRDGDSAARPDRDNNPNNAAQANGPAASQSN